MGKPNAKDRILEAAGRLFHEQGYSNVGINEIIKTADTAKASFYQHFPSKEALCEAWLETVHEKSENWRGEILRQSLPSVDKLNQYFSELSEYLVGSDYRGCPYTNTCAMVDIGSAGVMDKIKAHKESVRNFFEAILKQEYGESKEVTELANQIFIIYSGATTEAQNLRDLWPVESARKAAIALFEAFQR
jgi:AcrR family transcriptional regulator